jgi:choline dehydrogenase-like flavoprotein
MFIDAKSVPGKTAISADVCIVGGGAAGITLAREFAGQPFQVLLLESGGFEFDEAAQALYKGESVGLPYVPLDSTRLRFFGGSTNHWGGVCWPFREIDFQIRDWVPHSGWPFAKSHLDPYYTRAHAVLQLGPFDYDSEHWRESDKSSLSFVGDRVITAIYRINGLRFGTFYRTELKNASNIKVYLNATALEIETGYDGRTVNTVNVASLGGNRFSVAAKLFILATGGLENPRLLLLSNRIQNNGLGNQHDLVGRFFMDHPEVESGILLPASPSVVSLLYGGTVHSVSGFKYRGALMLPEKVQREDRLLNYSCRLYKFDEPRPGVFSLRELYNSARRGEWPDKFWKHVAEVIRDIDGLGKAVYKKWTEGAPLTGPRMYALMHRPEQAPNPASRVTLSSGKDAFGKNRLRLDWRLGALERHTIQRAHEIIAQEIGRAGLGRVRMSPRSDQKFESFWDGVIVSHHHCGTTRMHVDPKKGVVDDTCRVHGISNLFVGGSSVFPTNSHANPTLTIVALAVRLADHVKRLMKKGL